MARRLRVGIVGGGVIVQGQHLPNLLFLKDEIEVAGVADPSAKARAFIESRFGVPTFASGDELRGRSGLDAILVASPDFTHAREVLASLERGLHVFCEKPLCYGVEEADAIVAARDRAGRVVQVGYMKRHDPSYEACLDLLPGDGAGLRYVSVEVNDPDAWPFMEPHPYVQGDDVPADLIAEGRGQQTAQIERALGGPVPDPIARGFATAYCSALVHDVNLVHGMLDRMGVPDGEVVGAQLFAGGDGGLGTVRLLGGRAVWQMTHLTVPRARRLPRARDGLPRRPDRRARLPLALAEPPPDPPRREALGRPYPVDAGDPARLRRGVRARAAGLPRQRHRGRTRP